VSPSARVLKPRRKGDHALEQKILLFSLMLYDALNFVFVHYMHKTATKKFYTVPRASLTWRSCSGFYSLTRWLFAGLYFRLEISPANSPRRVPAPSLFRWRRQLRQIGGARLKSRGGLTDHARANVITVRTFGWRATASATRGWFTYGDDHEF